jgi:hypothetical protein
MLFRATVPLTLRYGALISDKFGTSLLSITPLLFVFKYRVLIPKICLTASLCSSNILRASLSLSLSLCFFHSPNLSLCFSQSLNPSPPFSVVGFLSFPKFCPQLFSPSHIPSFPELSSSLSVPDFVLEVFSHPCIGIFFSPPENGADSRLVSPY